ncbi:MAG: hypothetical protein ABIP75_09250 [Pyrinomonadaceae bacterium]
MAKSLRNGNWGCTGLLCFLFAVINLIVFTGSGSGLPSRMGHHVNGEYAIWGSVFFAGLGCFFLAVWLILKMVGSSKE